MRQYKSCVFFHDMSVISIRTKKKTMETFIKEHVVLNMLTLYCLHNFYVLSMCQIHFLQICRRLHGRMRNYWHAFHSYFGNVSICSVSWWLYIILLYNYRTYCFRQLYTHAILACNISSL